ASSGTSEGAGTAGECRTGTAGAGTTGAGTSGGGGVGQGTTAAPGTAPAPPTADTASTLPVALVPHRLPVTGLPLTDLLTAGLAVTLTGAGALRAGRRR
ncbi:MAG: hypothetical protein JWM64_1067, partial [Frankiales bacterium]|nr:hypothetical protein [Frankiales bacterium]